MGAMRALIIEGPEAWEGAHAEELKDETDFGLSLLLHYLFTAATQRVFAPSFSLSEVIRYVADVRLKLEENASQLNPRVAERLIRSALGDGALPDNSRPDDDQITNTRAKLLLLAAMTQDAALDESEIDDLINEAAENARQSAWSPLSADESAARRRTR